MNVASFYNIRLLDEWAEKDTFVHRIHPLAKVLTTLIFLVITVSYPKYVLAGLIPLLFYPVILSAVGEIPAGSIGKRILPVLPLIIGLGIFNPILDRVPAVVLPWAVISGGWISYASLLLKGILTASAAILLIGTTGLGGIAYALRLLRVPKIMILQLLLTYRYISVLVEEVGRTIRAYGLRAAGRRGIAPKHWGSLTGQLLLRAMDRAVRLYQAMGCRGFSGEYPTGSYTGFTFTDLLYIFGWSLYFVAIRWVNLPVWIGHIMTGAGK